MSTPTLAADAQAFLRSLEDTLRLIVRDMDEDLSLQARASLELTARRARDLAAQIDVEREDRDDVGPR